MGKSMQSWALAVQSEVWRITVSGRLTKLVSRMPTGASSCGEECPEARQKLIPQKLREIQRVRGVIIVCIKFSFMVVCLQEELHRSSHFSGIQILSKLQKLFYIAAIGNTKDQSRQ